MKLYKPKFWDHKNFISLSLFPVSLIIQLVILLKKKFTKISSFKIPIVCIGNIYVGGTGKTPLSILVSKELSKIGKKPVIGEIQEAKNKNFDTAILDDGFQDYKIKKDLSIICFNSNFEGNDFVIPAGPLRENLNSIKNAQIIVITDIEISSLKKKFWK